MKLWQGWIMLVKEFEDEIKKNLAGLGYYNKR